ncbi:MAG: ABC transporter permease family protein [Eubacteriales bacterium]
MLLFSSMVICCAVFIQFNSSYMNGQRECFSGDIKTHSVSVSFEGASQEKTAVEAVFNMLDERTDIEYYIVKQRLSKTTAFGAENVYAIIPVTRNPYEKIAVSEGSLMDTVTKEPEKGYVYLAWQHTNLKNREDITFGGKVLIDGSEYILQASLSQTQFDILLSSNDFFDTYIPDGFIYAYDPLINLKTVRNINGEINKMLTDVVINVSSGLSGDAERIYNQSFIILTILLFACFINIVILFRYIIKRREKTLMIMRLYGLTGIRMFTGLFLEISAYSLTAYLTTLICFNIFWFLSGGIRFALLNNRESLAIFAMFIAICLINAAYISIKSALSAPST